MRDDTRAARTGHLLEPASPAGRGEWSERLVAGRGVEVERIVSRGESSPAGFWYDQERAEWVAVVSGRARLRLAEPERVVELGPGDWIDLPAHCRHRVE